MKPLTKLINVAVDKYLSSSFTTDELSSLIVNDESVVCVFLVDEERTWVEY